MRLFVFFRVFFNSRFYYPIFTILFIDFGLTVAQFALLNAVWAASIVLMEVPSGALADTIGRRKLLVACSAFMILEMLLISLAPRGNPTLLFLLFLINRVLSGAAEAFASGADEAIAYDTLKIEGDVRDWGRVLEVQMRAQSIGFVVAMSIGAAVYDPALMQRLVEWLGFHVEISRDITLRLPVFLTLAMAVATLVTTLRMREPPVESDSVSDSTPPAGPTAREALSRTLQAGAWIARTPFALVIIAAGMIYDGFTRMVITLSSQYYRIIEIPEALFGVIGSAIALMGIFVPRIARWMADHRSPAFNFFSVGCVLLLGLSGMNAFVPFYGLAPAFILFGSMSFIGFFVSFYLNRITSSSQRATVLSFKGLSFNLFYGIVGIFYSLLLALKRPEVTARFQEQADSVENILFTETFVWFPWSFIIVFFLLTIFSAMRLRGSDRR